MSEDKKLKISDFLDSNGNPKTNIANLMSEDQRNKLGLKVIQEADIDLGTMSEWVKLTQLAMNIAKQVSEGKSFPWPDCANIKYPLITGAAIQFAARAYSEIIKGQDVVKGRVVGADPDNEKSKRAKRISQHMSFQLLDQMSEWEPQTDQMLHMLPVIGTCFKKSYFCPVRQRNVSELVQPGEEGLILNNKNVKDLETARRLTHAFQLYPNDIKERINSGVYLKDIDITKLVPADSEGDEQAPHWMYEQHRWLDLDKDGYEEPYIVTVHKDTSTVVRVVARYDDERVFMDSDEKVLRIEPLTYFTKFGFFPDPAGGFLDLGFGQILYPINAAINTTLNQLLDAGTLANTQGGFVARGFRIKAQTFSIAPGEWKQIDVPAGDLKNSLFPVPFKEPSNVLFQLLGFLVEAGKALANQTEVLQGETSANTTATTTLALIEQGLKVYNSIYKRFYRSMREEFRKLFRLNSKYLNEEEYFNVLDDRLAVARSDYNYTHVDVLPVADPNASTEVQRMARAQALMQIQGDPLANRQYILETFVDSIGCDPTKALIPAEQQQQQPDIKLLELEQLANYNGAKLQIDNALAVSQIDVNQSIIMANIAKAEATELGSQFDQYMKQAQDMHAATLKMMDSIRGMFGQGQEQNQPMGEMSEQGGMTDGEQGAVSGMEDAPGDGGISEVSGGLPGLTGAVLDPATDGRLNGDSDSV